MILAATVYFIACHGGPAAHFGEFASVLESQGHHVELIATGPAFAQLTNAGLHPTEFNPERLDLALPETHETLASSLNTRCASADVVITDVGHSLMETVHKKLSVRHLAYYDNPEAQVPGGYTETAARVMRQAQGVLFANAKLAKSVSFHPNQFAIGYFPLAQARKIAERREKQPRGQRVAVYFGGNNSTYFQQAFPAFLEMLAKTSTKGFTILLQQHPGAKLSGIDRKLAEEWTLKHPGVDFRISELSSDDAQALADVALYYQTSMGPIWALAKIPAIQVGHETYSDALVRTGLAPSVTTAAGLEKALQNFGAPDPKRIEEELGVETDWRERLTRAIFL